MANKASPLKFSVILNAPVMFFCQISQLSCALQQWQHPLSDPEIINAVSGSIAGASGP